jgi:hypothetical protein
MRVPRHDDVEARCPRIHIHFLHIVKHMDAHAFDLQRKIKRNLRHPSAFVVVSPHCIDGGYCPKPGENLRPADVACMNDPVDAGQGTDCLGAKQSVCIGDEAYRFQRS